MAKEKKQQNPIHLALIQMLKTLSKTVTSPHRHDEGLE